jgi:hypothetical protein
MTARIRIAAFAMVLVALAACARPGTVVGTEASPAIVPPSPVPSTSAGATTGCPAAGLAGNSSDTNGALGLRAMAIYLANCGNQPVTVEGYPVVRALDGDQRELDVEILNGTDPIAPLPNFNGPPQRVTAAPGERLVFVVVWRGTVADVTPPVNVRYLDVALSPGQPQERVQPEGGLDLGTTGRFAVTYWAKA